MSADLSGIEFCSLTVCFVELFVIQIKFFFFFKKHLYHFSFHAIIFQNFPWSFILGIDYKIANTSVLCPIDLKLVIFRLHLYRVFIG